MSHRPTPVSKARSVEPLSVTGLGATTPLGNGVPNFWQGLFTAGACFMAPPHFQLVNTESASPVGLVPQSREDRIGAVDRTAELACLAASEALRDGLSGERSAIGYIVGTTQSAPTLGSAQEGPTNGARTDDARLPADITSQFESRMGLPSGTVSMVTTASASGAVAIRLAADLVRAGTTEAAMGIGADNIAELAYAGLASLRVLGKRGCLPFRRDRSGIAISEAAGAILVEPLSTANAAEDSRPHALLLGSGVASSGLSSVRLDSNAITTAIWTALDEAGCNASDVGMINTHATGTVQGDTAELSSLRTVFGHQLKSIAITSWKAQTGHCQGAAGALEALGTVLAVKTGVIPPTQGLEDVDPEFADVDLTPEPREWGDASRVGMSISCGFGGTAAALVFASAGGRV